MTEDRTDIRSMQELRRSMQGSSDPRAARTREAIIAALHDLVTAKSGPVTVSAIVSTAHISRSSFYAQFASVDELAMVVLRDALVEISTAAQSLRRVDGVSGASVARTSVTRLVSHIDENRELYRTVANLPSYQASREAISAFQAELRDVIAVIRGRQGSAEDQLTAAYLAGGTIAVLSDWLRDPSLGSAEEIAQQLLAFLPNWFIAASGPVHKLPAQVDPTAGPDHHLLPTQPIKSEPTPRYHHGYPDTHRPRDPQLPDGQPGDR